MDNFCSVGYFSYLVLLKLVKFSILEQVPLSEQAAACSVGYNYLWIIRVCVESAEQAAA